MNILDRILDNKRREVETRQRLVPLSDTVPTKQWRSMARALLDSPTGIIAEFKRRSPSRGEIHPMAIAADVVASYARHGAAACSVLTDTPFFGGALTDLETARAAVDIPLLRKDFVVSGYQVREAAIHGADAVLLIAAALGRDEMEQLTALAHSLSLEVLVEIHSVDEIDRIPGEADMVGVNNRNLTTFETDPALAMTVARELPGCTVKVAESGLTSIDEVRRLRDAGFRGFLIGETFMKRTFPGEALAEFLKG